MADIERALPENPLESLHDVLVMAPRDWAINAVDAWIYGVVVGWRDSLDEVAAEHGWDAEAVARLKRLHEKAETLRAAP